MHLDTTFGQFALHNSTGGIRTARREEEEHETGAAKVINRMENVCGKTHEDENNSELCAPRFRTRENFRCCKKHKTLKGSGLTDRIGNKDYGNKVSSCHKEDNSLFP